MPIPTSKVILALTLLSLIIGMQYASPVIFFSLLLVAFIYYIIHLYRNQPTTEQPDDYTPPTFQGDPLMSAESKRLHLKSPEWRSLKRRVRWRDGNKCKLCHSTHNLHLHHLTYERLGAEHPSDLTLLCSSCHQLQHNHYGYSRLTNYYPLIKPKLAE